MPNVMNVEDAYVSADIFKTISSVCIICNSCLYVVTRSAFLSCSFFSAANAP